MSDTTETENADEVTTEDRQDAEVSAEALEAVAQATARVEFEDALRPPAPADAETAADEGDDGEDDPEGDGSGEGKPNREAAKLRHRAQTAEAERDALAAQLETMQRAAIDSHVGTMGMKPAALWASGAKLGDLLAEDGTPDTAKVTAAAQAAKEALGVQVYTKPRAGLQSGAMAHQAKRDKWVEAFGPQPS